MATSPRADAQRNRARILAAAEAVFAESGAAASTEEVARRAGVAIGTVFRHFPTKNALLQAIMKDLMGRLAAEADRLAAEGEPETALFAFLGGIVGEAAAKRSVVDLLADAGVDVEVADALRGLRQSVDGLLGRAKRAGVVADAVRLDEVMALLVATTQGALRAGWDDDLRVRTLAIVYAGLRSGA